LAEVDVGKDIREEEGGGEERRGHTREPGPRGSVLVFVFIRVCVYYMCNLSKYSTNY
jgi:hypothetical protein